MSHQDMVGFQSFDEGRKFGLSFCSNLGQNLGGVAPLDRIADP